ncbi:MAG: hypothetical protein LDL50_01140 [Chloroflexi bacterium]|nr:hypothetical protein [Chloroflexota bacterium]MCA2002491.1 hypothetical protein [Chloroflexota bacterium]
MSVALFFGTLFGALAGFSTRNKNSAICQYIFGKHSALARTVGLLALGAMILLPSLSLAGVIAVSSTPFFWGGCLACSFIVSFFMTSCLMAEESHQQS